MRPIIAGFIFLGTFAATTRGTVPFGAEPWWESDEPEYATGCMFYDIDGDGYLELVTGNGNDMEENREGVYDNVSGVLETTASWRSGDEGYGAQIDLADVDGDGDLDLAVANLGRYSDPRPDEVYINLGGYFETTPGWNNIELDNSFACAFGDYDLDGDPDLVTVSGYFSAAPIRIYENEGGTLSTTANWSTPVSYNCNEVEWVDIDGDGDLDLFAGGYNYPNWIFENTGGVVSTTPTWTSDDTGDNNQCDFGDFDGDGDLDLVITDVMEYNYDIGKVKIYRNAGGTLETLAFWTSDYVNNASTAKFGDMDGDGDLDLAVGGWWAPLAVYENDGGVFSEAPDWTYDIGTGLVSEQIIWGDVDGDGVADFSDDFEGDGARKLFYLNRQNLYLLLEVQVGGSPLGPGEYCVDLEDGWITLAAAPGPGETLTVEYRYSDDLELAVTNWSQYRGNFVFLNESEAGIDLISFDAVALDGRVSVRWDAREHPRHEGYNLYRCSGPTAAAERVRLNAELIGGDPPYVFLDYEVTAGVVYHYWLESVEVSGRSDTYGPASVTYGARPYGFALSQNRPNPVGAAGTTIPFSLPERNWVELAVFDITGRKVKTLVAGELDAGEYEVFYFPVGAPGVYLYRLAAGPYSAIRKMVVR